MNKCAKFHKDSPSGKKLNSISRVRLNFRRRPILCTTLYRNQMQASNFGGAFDQLFLWIFFMKFSQKMPLNVFYTMVQKSQKWPKTQIKGGPALILLSLSLTHGTAHSLSPQCSIQMKQHKMTVGKKKWRWAFDCLFDVPSLRERWLPWPLQKMRNILFMISYLLWSLTKTFAERGDLKVSVSNEQYNETTSIDIASFIAE